MGPGGAYGPAQYSPGQPVPGQLPVGLSVSATLASGQFAQTKPGTVTGIQVILYLFLAISAVGNVFSIMSMVELFNPFSLIGLAFAVYSAIQSLASGVQIARGKRWAWIWSLVSAILGLALSLTGFVFGVVMFDSGGDIMLTVAAVLVGLYGTLLGLLCSKSARQWILMHRIQRGEVQLPGTMGGMPAAAPMGVMPGAAPAPERPATRPGAATFMLVVLGLMMAISVWTLYGTVRTLMMMQNAIGMDYDDPALLYGSRLPIMAGLAAVLVLVCALISAIGIQRGKAGGRVFTLVWTPVLLLAAGFATFSLTREAMWFLEVLPPPARTNWIIVLVRDYSLLLLILIAFILAMVPGVRAWTPGKPPAPLIMVVPGPQAPPQAGPYGQAPQQQYPQQQSPYGGY
jgi:hypothetical protein